MTLQPPVNASHFYTRWCRCFRLPGGSAIEARVVIIKPAMGSPDSPVQAL
jgi:hypothetical protein